MSKELERIEMLEAMNQIYNWFEFDFQPIKTALKDYERRLELAKEYEDINNVAKRLKALEIIKEKRVNLEYLKCCETYRQYCLVCSYGNEIAQEEFDLVKEVLL